jgi:hypothetical protein
MYEETNSIPTVASYLNKILLALVSYPFFKTENRSLDVSFYFYCTRFLFQRDFILVILSSFSDKLFTIKMNAIRQCLSQLVQPARFCLVAPTKLLASSRVPFLQHGCPAAQHQLTARALHLSREAGRGHWRLFVFQNGNQCCGSGFNGVP